MKVIKKLVFAIMTIGILFSMFSYKTYAATGTISFSDPSVAVGSDVSVTVKISSTAGTQLGGADLTLAYDSSVLKFVSGTSASGDAGKVKLAGTSSATTTLRYTLKFKSLKAGTSKITVSSYKITTPDKGIVSISRAGSSTITATESVTEKTSSDCKLASLQISPGTLSPKFSPSTVKYTATVPNETTKLTVSATPTDAKASVTSVTGTKLSVGKNTVKVNVTAENGASVAYVITVTRKEASNDESSSDVSEEVPKSIQVVIGDVALYLFSDIPKGSIPVGFSEGSYTYKGNEVTVLKSSEGSLIVCYLTDNNGENGSLYLYDAATDQFTKFIPLQSGMTLVATEMNDSVTVPEGFTETKVTIQGTELTAYQNNANPDFYIIYAMNMAGEKGFYSYDAKEGTLQRYNITDQAKDATENSTDGSDTVSSLQKQILKLNTQYNSQNKLRTGIIFALVAAAAIFFITIINLLLKLHDKNEELLEGEPEEESEDEGKENDESAGFEQFVENKEAQNKDEDELQEDDDLQEEDKLQEDDKLQDEDQLEEGDSKEEDQFQEEDNIADNDNTQEKEEESDKLEKTPKEKEKKLKAWKKEKASPKKDELRKDTQTKGKKEIQAQEDSDFTFIDLDDDK